MESLLANLKFDKWYNLLIVVPAVFAISAMATGHDNLLIICLGVVMFGIGENANHTFLQTIFPATSTTPPLIGKKPVRSPKTIGIALDIIGLALVGVGAFRVVFL